MYAEGLMLLLVCLITLSWCLRECRSYSGVEKLGFMTILCRRWIIAIFCIQSSNFMKLRQCNLGIARIFVVCGLRIQVNLIDYWNCISEVQTEQLELGFGSLD